MRAKNAASTATHISTSQGFQKNADAAEHQTAQHQGWWPPAGASVPRRVAPEQDEAVLFGDHAPAGADCRARPGRPERRRKHGLQQAPVGQGQRYSRQPEQEQVVSVLDVCQTGWWRAQATVPVVRSGEGRGAMG
jgi:hypothetical protein